MRKSNLVSLARDELHRRITVGELAEGAKIVLADLATEFGISMIPVREALSRLTAEGLVIYEPNKGFSVAPALGPEEIANLFEARLVMELGALELGLPLVTAGTVAELRAINDRIRAMGQGESYDDFKGFIIENAAFHEILVGLTGNPVILGAYRRLGYHERIPRTMHGRGIRDLPQIVQEHDGIISAVEARDLERAREALKAHILSGYQRLPEVTGSPHSFRPLKASIPAR